MKEPTKVKNFFEKLYLGKSFFSTPPININQEFKQDPPIPWFEFSLPSFPHREILSEVSKIKGHFVEHRPNENHSGWKSVCLHGIDAYKTNCYFDYGYETEEEVNYNWTEISNLCPIATNYFKNIFPSSSYRRIRFMLVEPDGYIFPHKDRDEQYLGPLSICLNAPDKCLFGLKEHGLIPLKPGKGYLIDISNVHSVWNQSSEDRYHITVEMNPGKFYQQYLELLFSNYCKHLGYKKYFTPGYYKFKKYIS